MKKLAIITLSVLTITSCEAYETLKTPFDRAANKIGNIGSTLVGRPQSDELPKKLSTVGAYEVAVKAPPGAVKSTAVDLFYKEASKVCNGGSYKHKITHQGTTSHVEYLRDTSTSEMVPTVKGIVVCNDEAALGQL